AKVEPKMSDELKNLIVAPIRATYQNTKQIRELQGCIITTVRVSDSDPLAAAIEKENRNYAKAMRKEGASHARGPLAPGAALEMMECLATLDVGGKSKEQINQSIEKLNQMDEYQVQDALPICKIEKAFKSGQANIPFQLQGSRDTPGHHDSAAQCPEEACAGPAPEGFGEDELALWLDAITDD
ncbi:unnamed protein product, partial [Prorocentrum cordatum]